MLPIRWILQTNLIQPTLLERIQKALDADNIPHQGLLVLPFSDTLDESSLSGSYFNLFYGSSTLMLNAAKHPTYSKGVFYSPERFNVQAYLQAWGQKMLNWDTIFTTFGKLLTESSLLEQAYFVRPNSDEKAFCGGMLLSEEIYAFARSVADTNNPYLSLNTPICISQPKELGREWRHFIVGAQIVASCRYAVAGELNVSVEDVPPDLLEFVRDCVAAYVPHPIFVLDTCESAGQYWILEANCFNGTGFYHQADAEKVFRAVNGYLLKT